MKFNRMKEIATALTEVSMNTGYSYDFLADRFNECVEDGQTAEEAFEFVEGVSNEHDWDEDPYDRWDVEPSRSDWDEVEPAWGVAM